MKAWQAYSRAWASHWCEQAHCCRLLLWLIWRALPGLQATVAAFNAVLFATRGHMEHLLAHEDGACETACDCGLVSWT